MPRRPRRSWRNFSKHVAGQLFPPTAPGAGERDVACADNLQERRTGGKDQFPQSMPTKQKTRFTSNQQTSIFVVVQRGVAEVDLSTVPAGINVEVIDLDDLAADARAEKHLSGEARTYARKHGYL